MFTLVAESAEEAARLFYEERRRRLVQYGMTGMLGNLPWDEFPHRELLYGTFLALGQSVPLPGK